MAWLPVAAGLAHQQHVAQVRNVAGSQAERLNLGELAVRWLRGDERAQCREGRVHAVGSVPLARVCCVSLPGFAAWPTPRSPASPGSPAPGPPPSALQAAARSVHAAGLFVRARALAAAVFILRQRAHFGVQVAAWRRRAQHGERDGWDRRQLRRALLMPPPAAATGRGPGAARSRLRPAVAVAAAGRPRAHVRPGWSGAASLAFIAAGPSPARLRRPAGRVSGALRIVRSIALLWCGPLPTA